MLAPTRRERRAIAAAAAAAAAAIAAAAEKAVHPRRCAGSGFDCVSCLCKTLGPCEIQQNSLQGPLKPVFDKHVA